ncbi:hypothetical protein MtrunA17_Chr8g0339081 [Medicago truncatula]|uniref:Transmembrane protein n=1 Tax=Medicago truncatula TaxID=3880 RepID=A0A396GFH7_MEDTR|nr:hypothetical protein MtrunA17_Chr8g0339081 [Medicago truncatula]
MWRSLYFLNKCIIRMFNSFNRSRVLHLSFKYRYEIYVILFVSLNVFLKILLRLY